MLAPRRVSANHGSLRVAAQTSWVDDSTGYLHIPGVVANDSGSAQQFVEIVATFYNGSEVVGTDFTFADLSILAPHSSAPFEIIVTSVPANMDHYVLQVGGDATSEHAAQALQISRGSSYVDASGYLHLLGEVENKGSQTVEFTEVVAVIYQGSAVLAVDFTFTNPDSIAPAAKAPFELVVLEHYTGYTKYSLQADASTASNGYATSWDNYFADLGGTSFRTDTIWIAESGITTGCGTARYCPDDSVTRGQMASFLARALSLPTSATDYFTDDDTSIFEADINRVAKAGIASGCTATTYCPNATVTRGQMAAFLARALKLPSTATDYFTDDGASIFQNDINRVRAAGIAFGCTTTTYCPNDPVTRGQMAAFLHRAFG